MAAPFFLDIIPLGGELYAVVQKMAGEDGEVIDTLFEGTLEEAQTYALNVATQLGIALDDLGEDIKAALSSLGSNIGNATLEVIEGAGVALVNGVDKAYDYIRLKLRGKEPDVITGLTVGLLTILTGTYLVYAARRGTMKFSE